MAEAVMVSPSNYNVKSKYAYLRMKNCSPKFKTVLRQRYKERVQKSRCELLNRFRHTKHEDEISSKSPAEDLHFESTISKSEALQDIFGCNKEFNLDEELLLEDCLKEDLTQFENWLLQEYESFWNEEENNEIIIICPLCCKGRFDVLESCKNTIFCTKCHQTFTTERSIFEIQNYIFSEVDKHNMNCTSDPAFVQVPANETHSNLCIVCDICSYLQHSREISVVQKQFVELV